jgi:putative membrane protein
MKSNTLIAAAFAAIALFANSTQAADSKSTLNSADETFVKTASQQGIGEVQIAAMGVKKSARADVKALAAKMVTAHTAANAELAALAKTKAVEISTVTDPADTEKLKDLENTDTGPNFDKAFLEQLEEDHEATIDLFDDAAKDSTDAEVKAWAGKMLPDLRAHLDAIQKALKK